MATVGKNYEKRQRTQSEKILQTFVMAPAGANIKGTCVKFDELFHFACGDVHHDGVIDLHQRVRVADGSAIVSCQVGHVFLASAIPAHTAKLVLESKTVFNQIVNISQTLNINRYRYN